MGGYSGRIQLEVNSKVTMSKNSIISLVSALTFLSLVSPVAAEELTAINRTNTSFANPISPYSLVNSSYQGRFADQGIPSNVALLSKIHSHQIKAADLVKGAIASGRLSEDTLNDARYLNSVKFFMNILGRN